MDWKGMLLDGYESDQIIIRPARTSDQAVIMDMVRTEGLVWIGVRWPQFLVVEVDGQVVGIGQIKRHLDGSCELASLAVRAPYRRRGIGSLIVTTLLTEHPGTVFLICPQFMQPYYERFGFHHAKRQLTPYFFAVSILIPIITLVRRLRGHRRHVVIMSHSKETSGG